MRKMTFVVFLAAVLVGARASAAPLAVPRWLDPPKLDGLCSDAAYERGESLSLQGGGSSTQAVLVHSSLDLYVCLSKVGTTVQRIAVRVDPDPAGADRVAPGDYVFRATQAGTVQVEQGNADGKLVPFTLPGGGFAAKVAPSANTWSAELRIPLEWLGGYGHTAGLSLALESSAGTVLQQWPDQAAALSPRTWGGASLEPVYPAGAVAGSAFLDGREGYLVVPYSPALNPQELTIEAWVRAVDGDCGTLAGNGQASSYWLALCEGVRFGHGGASSVRGGPHPLGNGWHHVAATMDGEGLRTLYVDGAVVLQPGWEPAHERSEEEEEETPAELGASTFPLRIGSDRDVPEGDPLHGYVRELRIWSRARTAAEIRAAAFLHLRGDEPGLVALWPFTKDLRDVAGGHHAGLIGNAALAREAPQVTKLPDPPPFKDHVYPGPAPVAAWDARVPAIADEKGMKLDGECTRAEYAPAARLALEPDRGYQMRMLATGKALYLCTNVLAGPVGGASSAATLWIDRDGKVATSPQASDLRLRLTPDGKVEIGTGKGQGYTGPAPTGIEVKTVRGDRLQAQEDLYPFEAPWWTAEVRIPWTALAPFQPGQSLRFAIAYDGETPAGSGLPEVIKERWPKSFNELRSDTWGLASTDAPPAPAQAQALSTISSALISSAPRTHISTDAFKATVEDGLPVSPTADSFNFSCAEFPLNYVTNEEFKWPMVDGDIPVVQVSGTLTRIHVSAQDSHYIHTSHDVDMAMTVRPEDRFAVLGGASDLILETESFGFPPHHDREQGARPSVGDHITALGRWIFDCGHEPKTEVHPIPLFESDRLEVRPLWPGGPQRTVRMVRVWMNSDPEPWGYRFTGPFTFHVDLPPAGWSPFVRVVEGTPSRVTATREGDRMKISVDPPDFTGTFFFELMVGHLVQPEDFLSRNTHTATIGSWDLDILDDHDHGFPPDCFSLSAFEDCGELFFAVNVNGRWRQILWDDVLASGMSRTELDSFQVSGTGLNIQVTAHEQDATIPDGGGEPLSNQGNQGGLDLGAFDNPRPNPILGPAGDWRLRYHVTPGGEMPASLVEQSFWEPRLASEPNDTNAISLGTLPVPAQGAPALTTSRDGFLTEPPNPLSTAGINLFEPDVDRYRFALADFADVEILPLPASVGLEVEHWSPWQHNPPSTLRVEVSPGVTQARTTKDVIGSAGARLKVFSPNGPGGDRPYTLSVRTSYREVPRDWGELLDSLGLLGGRALDLATAPPDPAADPRLEIEPASQWTPETRTLAADWAWQHVATDKDYYRVIVPPVAGPPPGHTACQYDSLGRLIVTAHPMTISIPSLGLNGLGVVAYANLRQTYPNGGSIPVEVSAAAPPRRLYQLEAQWEGSRYYTPAECEQLRQSMLDLRRLTREGELEILKGIIALQGDRVPGNRPPWPGPDPAPSDLPPLGDFRSVVITNGDLLDLVVSSPDGEPVVARLFDDQGVLLGEGTGVDEATADSTQAPDGMVPQSRLKVEGLKAGRAYLLQVVPRETGRDARGVRLGFGEGPR